MACGTAWSSIAIARAYPAVTVDALDVDEASIAVAQRNVSEAGLSDRVRPAVHDASAPQLPGRYDLVTIFEALHDMNHPVEALRAARTSLTERGCVIVADEKVAERFTPNGDELERFNYGWSVLHCLAVGLLDADSAGTGTVLRTDTLPAMQPTPASPGWMCCRSTIHSGGSTGSGSDRSQGPTNPAIHRRYAMRGPGPVAHRRSSRPARLEGRLLTGRWA